MRSRAAKAAFLLGCAALVVALPAAGQDNPDSLLPPGFGGEAPPSPAPRTEAPPAPEPRAETASPTPQPTPARRRSADAEILPPSETDLVEVELPPPPPPIEYPAEARRDPDRVGVFGPEHGALGDGAWGQTHGRFLSTLMRRMDAPLPSRWGQIALRRALLSPVPTPRGLNGADWVAERAWLLLRMGDADGARLLVAGVDTDRFTPKLTQVAVEAALASADPAGLCPLQDMTGAAPRRPLIQPMCASLGGEPGTASAQIASLRRRRGPSDLDLLLAEKVAGAGGGTRSAVGITWEGVDSLSTWRFGLASATAVPVPAALYGTVGPHVRAWAARAPLLPWAERIAHARVASTLGVFSAPGLVELYAMQGDTLDASEWEDSEPGRLARAYRASFDGRRGAFRALWGHEAASPVERYVGRVLTGGAATLQRPDARWGADAVGMIEALFAAGHDRHAARWANVVAGLDGEPEQRAWALLAVGAPNPGDVNSGRVGSFIGADASPARTRSRMLVAALAGIGRLSPADAADLAGDLGFDPGRQTAWTRALARAAGAGERGTVLLLAAAGLQAADPASLSPANLFHITRALTAVDEGYAARMIAAEVLTRQ